MNTVKKVSITKFWGDKTVTLNFQKRINFLIGVNGSGKTTIINLIAAALSADFRTLDRIQFEKLTIELQPESGYKRRSDLAIIEVEKKERESSPYPDINFKIRKNDEKEIKLFDLDSLEEDNTYRYSAKQQIIRRNVRLGYHFENDIYSEISDLVNLSWLSIHRTSPDRKKDERSFESTIDQKVEELQIDLVKYFSQLNRRYTDETEIFQKYIFESLIEKVATNDVFSKISVDKEKNALRSIFRHFKLNERSYEIKINSYFNDYEKSFVKADKPSFGLEDFSFLLGALRIHSVVEKWNKVIEKQININKPKELFLKIINGLFQRKEIVINLKNELVVKTQSGKIFPLTTLSSGEKQLLIILGQSLLQDEKSHIYIADEPELSLHIEWQEKLVDSLNQLNPKSQIIFATHSPDIVSNYRDSVIKIEETII